MKPLNQIDKHKVQQSFAQASASYDDFAFLQRTVATELLRATGLSTLAGKVLDLGCGTGYLTRKLFDLGGFQQLIALDIAQPMLQQAQQRLGKTACYVCADLEQLPLQAHSIEMMFSSLALQWCTDLPATLRDCQRVLKPQGKLIFATFGATTLKELKHAWAQVDAYQHVNDFYTLAELADVLQAGGWQKVQINSKIYACQYASVWSLMRELKGIGAHNVMRGRKQQLTGKIQLQRMLEAYPRTDADQIKASYEVIWVQAEACV